MVEKSKRINKVCIEKDTPIEDTEIKKEECIEKEKK